MRHILIADDHEVTRRGVREIVLDSLESVQVTEAVDAASLYGHLPSQAWSMIVLDFILPDANAIEIVSQIRASDKKTPILVLTGLEEIEVVVGSLKAGANGFIRKSRQSGELMEAIRKVAGGGRYLHPETAIEIAQTFEPQTEEALHERLSTRELDVFLQTALGQGTKEIASNLGIRPKTVATYLARIREKTQLANPVEITRYAMQQKLVE